MRPRVLPRAFMAVICLIAACGGMDGGDWAGTVEMLPGGIVRVTNPPEPIWAEDGGWRLEPELTLGSVEGEGADVFGTVAAFEVGQDGRIYIVDRQANELRIFGPDGAHLTTVGRAGGGPGEYTQANGVEWLTPDSLIVIDQQGGRYSILTPDGEYVRFVRRALPFYGWVFVGFVRDRTVYEQFSVGDRPDDPRPAYLGTRLDEVSPAAATNVEDPTTPVLAGAKDTVLLPEYSFPRVEAFSVRSSRGGMSMSVPFAPGVRYQVDPAGNLWHGWAGEPRLFRSTFAGDTTLEIVLAIEPLPVTDAELEQWRQGAGVQRFVELGGDLDMSRIPRTKPYFEGITVAGDGHLWLSVPGAPDEAHFIVLDPDGRYLGQMHIPDVRVEGWLPPIIRRDRLYVVGSDELGVQRLFVYRIVR